MHPPRRAPPLGALLIWFRRVRVAQVFTGLLGDIAKKLTAKPKPAAVPVVTPEGGAPAEAEGAPAMAAAPASG